MVRAKMKNENAYITIEYKWDLDLCDSILL